MPAPRPLAAAIAGVLVLALSGCLPFARPDRRESPTPTPTPFSTAPIDPSDRIAYVREEFGGHVDDPPLIWTANADGSDARPLVGEHRGENLAVSPDRTRIAFDFEPDFTSPSRLAVVNIDGSGYTEIATSGTLNEKAAWSPDGESILFQHSPDGTRMRSAIWVMGADGSNQRQLIAPVIGTRGGSAQYSPDGTRLLFIRTSLGAEPNILYTADTDGSGLTEVFVSPTALSTAAWSPDGSTIVLARGDLENTFGGDDYGIWSLPAEGGDPNLLVRNTRHERYNHPSFSPDGGLLLLTCTFISTSATDNEPLRRDDICLADADGGDVRVILEAAEEELSPVWF